jgi:hypothetical protein
VTPEPAHGARIAVPGPGGGTELSFQAFGDVDALEWGDEWVSPIYGSRTLGRVGRLVTRGVGRRDLITLLVPLRGGDQAVVRELPCTGGRAVAVDRPGVHDVVVFREMEQARVGTIQVDADVALVRRGSASGPVDAVALLGSTGRLEVDSLAFEVKDAAELRRAAQGWSVAGEGRVISR